MHTQLQHGLSLLLSQSLALHRLLSKFRFQLSIESGLAQSINQAPKPKGETNETKMQGVKSLFEIEWVLVHFLGVMLSRVKNSSRFLRSSLNEPIIVLVTVFEFNLEPRDARLLERKTNAKRTLTYFCTPLITIHICLEAETKHYWGFGDGLDRGRLTWLD
jgi:hypothetical protein